LSSLSAVNPVAAQSTVAQTKVNQSANNLRPYEPTVADLPLSFKSSKSISLSANAIAKPNNAAPKLSKDNAPAIAQSKTSTNTKPIFIAQESSSSPDALRNQLRIKPLPIVENKPGNAPSLSFGIPSAFGAGWGNAFISASSGTPGKGRNGQVDGSISAGFGLGSSNTLGLEISYNQGSIKNFGRTGTFDAKIHRVVYAEGTNQVGVAVGWNAFAQHLSGEPVIPSSLYGAVTTYSLLQADDSYNKMPISFTAGVGGGNFRQGNASTGIFGGVGLQVHPQVGVGLSWSGVGLNAGVSYVPYPEIPLTFVLTGGDLTDNSAGGTVLIFSASYGFNFLPR
jgi:hypothetical protein